MDLPDPARIVILLVAAQRLAELAVARRNTARLMAEGAVEHGREHYPVIVALHAAWLTALALQAPGPVGAWWLALFLMLQAGRVWVLASLGRHWTTRIVTVPTAPLVRRGPYRWIRHPNYLVVALEIPVLALALGLPWMALGFGAANAAVLAWRIRIEDRALAGRRGIAGG
ncbi:membrane protein [Thalassobaculum fulvum]|uniref:Membrane protein n=1 Tax=Thalassobaculum fulvum TaxID=1633335 RepID=A0A919CPH3_9PROT|nr:isoprenylcysteine carboxylmethyltransferase family protein [Thalassobaculum fulvum]GHD50453.1 membrane protein [Thalassobaculum fulvum]